MVHSLSSGGDGLHVGKYFPALLHPLLCIISAADDINNCNASLLFRADLYSLQHTMQLVLPLLHLLFLACDPGLSLLQQLPGTLAIIYYFLESILDLLMFVMPVRQCCLVLVQL